MKAVMKIDVKSTRNGSDATIIAKILITAIQVNQVPLGAANFFTAWQF